MSISAINALVGVSTPLRKKDFAQVSLGAEMTSAPNKVSELPSFSTVSMLSQMPNVSFKGYNYKKDNLSAYDNYSGPTPPAIEQKKYRISVQVQEDIENENYLAAIKGKIELAKICKSQGKESDAYILEESVRDLYSDLPKYQRNSAKSIIRSYNRDMADYIDDDIR